MLQYLLCKCITNLIILLTKEFENITIILWSTASMIHLFLISFDVIIRNNNSTLHLSKSYK